MALPVLDGSWVTDTFDCEVRGRIHTPLATIERHDYQFHGRQSADFECKFSFLDLALSRRPGNPCGHYVGAPGIGTRALGEVIFIPAATRLQSEWGGGQQSSICLQFRTGESEDRLGWTGPELDASLDVRSPFAREALLRLAREVEEPGFESKLMAEAICMQLGIELGRYFRGIRSDPDDAAGRLSPRQLRRIEERLDVAGPPPSVTELAKECGYSTRHFFRLFRTTTGTTLSEFAIARRVARARALLAEQQVPIKQISWQCGFETAAAFSAAFRRATGYQPKEYRRLMSE